MSAALQPNQVRGLPVAKKRKRRNTAENGTAAAAATDPAAVGLFDWSELNRYSDRFPHLLLLGKTGSGKTTLAE